MSCWKRAGLGNQARRATPLQFTRASLPKLVNTPGRSPDGNACLCDGPAPLTIVLLPDEEERGEADEEHGRAHHRLPLVCAPVHLGKALLELKAVQFNFLIDGEAAPGSLLLLLQGLLAGRQVLDVGHVGQGVVTPVHITRESIIFTLYNTS